MSSAQPHDERGRFTVLGDQPLSSKVRGVRLPTDVDQYLEEMSSSERPAWMRKVLTEAVRKEVEGEQDDMDFSAEELAESDTAWQSYVNGEDSGLTSEALKAELFG